jgi:tellurite resistance protein TerC
MTVPVWVWAASAAALIAVVGAEVALTGRYRVFTTRRAIGWVAVYVSLAVLFGLAVGVTAGWVTAGQFYTGYLTEYSLSLDNLFVFYVIISWFEVPPERQPRVLLLGIGLALFLRSILIVAGATALNHFGWLFYPLGAVLVWTAIGLIAGAPPGGQADRHTRLTGWLRHRLLRPGRRAPSGSAPVFLLVVAIGVADLLFAFDSIPAVFGITTTAALVVACNAFALMGLRQLYALVAGMLGRLAYLNRGLAIVCAFIGVRLLLRALHDSGVRVPMIPAWLSVLVVASVLLVTIVLGAIEDRRPLGAAGRAMLERRFAVIDTDGNGVWQREDYRLLTQRLCETFGYAADSAAGHELASAQRALFDTMLSHMDANRDDEISREEFVAGLGRGRPADGPGFEAAVSAAARSLIQVADADGNGVLDPGEYARLAAVYGAGADEAERAFGRLDQDRNGVLDVSELTLAISQFFASRDPRSLGSLAFGRL